ncbi:Glycerophosphoryl diester phosphodiesterase [Bosea sp. 62]|uniref:glycerophosphodiester phosphodiesterase n=1 Tax=unclassified Bosea (in: a-proteobacteria) TaxID=2653178 RepID=UPI0012576953|nr:MULTISPECIES: glycerophosphodiester phosphodiesterase family protein [unclassified Bosea (in: a-proteobacteria)]CAD5251097.1 Glycerophosphoryl diester phosphodiesterase [Bosea sp. 7B]CAD5281105.1 Glycerophosphoryl diester phosphodiesterase [Bosea sp. 21B]CAD5282257.1 Glycerophosphoryl diester phosphodiesterase [Bosea sp. 46]VVT59354.1 Glycerophosphoryl diester phosphodiesterase [Bosea sp. EC-HK365B]VXB25693.1 Glycerophosphoryl diester phosphodiesterase [Bosea sp. 62]
MSFAIRSIAGPLPLAIAHRGGALLASENSAEAFDKARAIGAEMVETDVRLSADGALVCLHDADLKRIAGDRRLVAEIELAELRAILPDLLTLDEAIAASAPLGLLLDVKLTGPAVLPRILDVVAAAGASERVLLGLRSLDLIAAARALQAEIAILALVPDPQSCGQSKALGADWFRFWQGEATTERIVAARGLGLRTVVMVGQPRSVAEPGYPPFPVGRIDAEGIGRVLALAPDAVMLDDPRQLLSTRSVTALSSS